MMNEQQEAGRRRVEKLLAMYGCLPEAPDGPTIPGFNPQALAEAMRQEIKRAAVYGWPKLTLHMDMVDAVQLEQFLRERSGG